jgi:RNA polymerase sigma factor (sigma-70 family)
LRVTVPFDIRRTWDKILLSDARAWKQLVDTYAALVLTVARRAGLSDHDAEDCLQQTWLALYRRRRSIKDPSAIPAWLIRTAHRKALNISQRFNRPTDKDHAHPAPSAPLPDDVVATLEQEALLDAAIGQLDPQCRQLISALFLSSEGKSYRELATELNIRPNSLGPMRTRCLNKLKKILKNLGYDWD